MSPGSHRSSETRRNDSNNQPEPVVTYANHLFHDGASFAVHPTAAYSPYGGLPGGSSHGMNQGMIWSVPPRDSDIPQITGGLTHPHTMHSPFFHGGSYYVYGSSIVDPETEEPTESFSGAHNINIGTANMFDYTRVQDLQCEEEKVLKEGIRMILAKAMPDAMLYSEARSYPPRCNEDTRRTMRDGLLAWGRRDHETQPLLWLSGPAAVGKSAVAQTVAETIKEEECLGGVFFFSRPNNRSNPNVVIPTLVYQMMLLLPPYKRIVAHRLNEDPTILSQDRRTQFTEFFTKPFITNLATRPLNRLDAELLNLLSCHPLLLVLDGLDECNNQRAQCELVELIGHHVKRNRDSCLRWMVCSRPEPHLNVVFSSQEIGGVCHQERLEIDVMEAQEDALRILRRGFSDVADRYPDHVDVDWPQESQILFIAKEASGHLGFASFIIRFIGDEEYDDPSGQLTVCLDFLQRTSGSAARPNPLLALDLLYTRILSDVQKKMLHYTDSILGTLVLYGHDKLTALALANFLGLTKATFYGSLQRLHSVLLIPNPNEVHKKSIRVYHASFFDFLKDSARSGNFAVDEAAIHFDVASSSLEWLRYYCKNPSEQELVDLSWVSAFVSRQTLLDSVSDFGFHVCWGAFSRTSLEARSTLIPMLKTYDFNFFESKWQEASEKMRQEFAYFIRWLVTSDAGIPVHIDCWHSYHDSKPVVPSSLEDVISWGEPDPYSFIQTIIKDVGHAPEYSISLHIMNNSNPARFILHPYNHAESIAGITQNDNIIALCGSRDSGKYEFIDLLAEPLGQTCLNTSHLRPGSTMIYRIPHPSKSNKNITLVRLPESSSYGDIEHHLTISGLTGPESFRRGSYVGAIYFNSVEHDKLSSILDDLTLFHSLCDRTESRADFVTLVNTTPQESFGSAAAVTRIRRVEKVVWENLIAAGARLDYFNLKDPQTAQRIVKNLLQARESLPGLLGEGNTAVGERLLRTRAGWVLSTTAWVRGEFYRRRISRLSHMSVNNSPGPGRLESREGLTEEEEEQLHNLLEEQFKNIPAI
ncbi:hypothetical protein NP233_g1959 [Leucocoprinus birnbaumii]|uniref:Nephrocystin 3-like N-terminal domain-containing protein n=1 Tax=Leucocoprinus birnbaumii TaxID=56174 RepID=A0AAD5YU98_9AGAR|nr:hypothetical protein NP233_g1959 [Leucocoprinus birnbaumii]